MVYRKAKETLTAVELDCGETLEFELLNGEVRTLTLEETSAAVLLTNVDKYGENHALGRTLYHFTCRVRADGLPMTMERYVCSQETFYEPYVVNGMRVWFDGVADIFTFLKQSHGPCKPGKQARFAVQDMTLPICPQELQSWCPDDENFIDVGRCYNGDDPWMGPYLGFDAHGGLDINHPKGTPIWAPLDLDDQYYFNSLATGDNNNRWRAFRVWPDGSTWILQTAHMIRLLVPEHTPVRAGTQIAEGAGVLVGSHEHSHFAFKVQESKDMPAQPEDRVEVSGVILSETDDAYCVRVGDLETEIPKRHLLYMGRPGRAEESLFAMPRALAQELGLPYSAPQILLDPWIIFWQIFENKKRKAGEIRAAIRPLSPTRTGEPVVFSSEGSASGPVGGELRYFWTFGDGGYATGDEASHTYLWPGIYPVTLVVDDGAGRASFTQHITVQGDPLSVPGLALEAPDETSFRPRPVQATDVYGWPVRLIPNTLEFTARPSRPVPDPKVVILRNSGGGILDTANGVHITYSGAGGWLNVVHKGRGNGQKLEVSVDATDLKPGDYEAKVSVDCPGAFNSPQSFRVLLTVPETPPAAVALVDDQGPGFYCTPHFWVGHRFYRWEEPGYGGFYLINGRRPTWGEFARFTPDLEVGRYEVRFHEQTPFDPDSKFFVRVRHAKGEERILVQPAQSRLIGTFFFNEGTDGFVEILAGGSEGQVVADAVLFTRVGG